jgi:hypothetical protein
MRKKTREEKKDARSALVSFSQTLPFVSPKQKKAQKFTALLPKLMKIYFVCLLSIWAAPNCMHSGVICAHQLRNLMRHVIYTRFKKKKLEKVQLFLYQKQGVLTRMCIYKKFNV